MKERKAIKLRIKTTEKHFEVDYVFRSIFSISEKSKIGRTDSKGQPLPDLAEIAKEFVIKAARRGDEGLLVSDAQDMIETYKISRHQYFLIIRRLKQAGILRKSKGKFYVISDFSKHLGEMSAIMNRFYMSLGVNI
jgi:hypothetical protein